MKNEQKNMAYHMLVFKEVSLQGSFTKTADVLGLKKSSVSQYISQLENYLGTQLLSRTTRSLSLTDAGKIFIKHCHSLDTLLSNAVEDIQELNNQPQGLISITVPNALAAAIVLPAISELTQRFTMLSVKVVVDDQVLDIVKEGFDVALRVGNLADSSYQAKRVGQLHSIFVASPLYLDRSNKLESVMDLHHHPFIATQWQQGTDCQRVFLSDGEPVDLPCPVKFETNNTSTAAQLACLGSGIALLPNIFVQPYLANGDLHRVFPEARGEYRSIYAIHHYPNKMPFKIRAFIDLLEEKLSI